MMFQVHDDLGTVFKYYIAAEYHSLIGWGIQHYPLGIYANILPSNRHNLDTRTRCLPGLVVVLSPVLSHHDYVAFTTVVTHNWKPVLQHFSGPINGPHHLSVPIQP